MQFAALLSILEAYTHIDKHTPKDFYDLRYR